MTTKLVRSVAALVIIIVLGVQLSRATGRGVDMVDYVSYFTFFSNAGAAVVLASLVIRPTLLHSQKFTAVRGAVTLCMCLTALLYGTWISPSLEGAIRHGVGPFVLVADWLLHPPPRQTFKPILQWPLLPVAYFAYTLVRGSVVGWYPYPFLNPENTGGWPGVIRFASIILVLLLGTSFCLLKTTQMTQPQRSS